MPLQRGIRNPDLFLSRPDTRQTSEETDIVNTIENLNASQIAFTPAGSLASTTVQAALVELDSDLSAATIPYSSVNNVTTARLLGRTTAGTGAAELISIGSGLSLAAGTLSATGGGITIGNAVSGGGANRVLYEDGSQNLATNANLTYTSVAFTAEGTGTNIIGGSNGADGVSALQIRRKDVPGRYIDFIPSTVASGGAGATITTPNVELKLSQTGDSLGTTFLVLQNRSGSNGAIFGNSSLDLVDFGFQPSTTSKQHLLRFEARGGSVISSNNSSGEFQFLGTSGAGYPIYFAAGMSAVTIQNGAKFGIGITNPSIPLHVANFTTEQMRVGYDGSNYFSTTVSSTGGVTFDAVGSGAGFTFSDNVVVPGFRTAYVAKTANYTLTAADYTVECTANSFTITLPTAVGVAGQIYEIKNSGTGTITIATTSSQTIDGNISGAITLTRYDNLTVQSTGANWIIL